MSKKYYTVLNSEDFIDIEHHIKENDYFAFDTETTGLNVRKDTVIGMSFTGKEGEAYYMPRFTWKDGELQRCWDDEAFVKILNMLLDKELLMWNASYDARIVKNNFGIDLLPALTADIMLMKHTVDEERPFGLKDVALLVQDRLGMDMEKVANEEQIELKENVKKNGGSTTKDNYEMYKADLPVMAKYACADADLTLKLAHYYMDLLEEQELTEFFFDKEVMPLYKEVTIKMEEKGIQLDMELLQKANEQIQKDLQELERQVIDQILSTKDGKKWLDFSATSKFPPKKSGRFAQAYVKYHGLDLPKTKSGSYSLSKSSIEKLPDSYPKVFLLTGEADFVDEEVAVEIARDLWVESNGNYINISSKKQMGEIVFDYMGIKPLSKTDKGNPQFNDGMIQELENMDIDWARTLGNYNKLVKIKGAYIDRFLDAQEDGIFYPSFFQHRTISGRYGSDMQQLPRPKEEGELDAIVLYYTNMIRKFFISGEGRVFIDNDYESLEPHVFAHVSGDEGLKNIFRNGHDFYSTIAIATEGLEGVSADKKADNYLGKVNKPLRQKAKAYALGVPYGMGGYALGMTLGIPTEDAEGLIDQYLNGFPKLKEWMETSNMLAQEYGMVSSEMGRIRHVPRVKELYRKHKNNLTDFKYRNKLISRLTSRYGKEEAKKMVNTAYKDYKNQMNNCKNFQIQSLSASIVNLAAIEINRELDRRGIDGWVALQIHDQLVVNVPEDKAEECAELVQDIMENNYKLSIDLHAPAEVARNLYDGH
jgi:DNA polymerase I-like protein with 3'-5' exonuclease and polymerase domains